MSALALALLRNIAVLKGNITDTPLSFSSFDAAISCLVCLALLSNCIPRILAIYVARDDSLSLRLALFYPSI